MNCDELTALTRHTALSPAGEGDSTGFEPFEPPSPRPRTSTSPFPSNGSDYDDWFGSPLSSPVDTDAEEDTHSSFAFASSTSRECAHSAASSRGVTVHGEHPACRTGGGKAGENPRASECARNRADGPPCGRRPLHSNHRLQSMAVWTALLAQTGHDGAGVRGHR